MFRALSRFVALALAGLVATGCEPAKDRPGRAEAPVVPFAHRFVVAVGGQPVRMRIAVHPAEQQRGLMFVEALPEDEGMLFVYERPRQMSYWMRNVSLPLDIGFFDADGRLREIRQMYPNVEDSVRSEAGDLQFALEMNQGWFGRHGVGVGAELDLGAVQQALEQRGIAQFQVARER